MDISITSDTKVYVFDYTQSRKDNQLYAGVASDIMATSIPDSQIIDAADGSEIIPWGAAVDSETVATANDVYFAFAKVVDGAATDVFVIFAD